MISKVMAGDKIDVFGKSYYFQNTSGTAGNSTLPVLDLLNAFLSSPASVGTSHGISGSSINVPAGLTGISSMVTQQTSQSNASPTKPRAFINVIFFDEQFKTYDGGFSISMVGNNSTVKDHYSELQNLIAHKSGYVYIYCSNESPVNVFFDNIQVVHTKGALLEETHYYPFGLTMAGISSKAVGITPNKEQTFQGQRFDDEMDLNWVQFKWRNHDPQIGRFIEIDPLSEDYVYNSTYAFSENKVTAHVELEGLESKSINDIQSPAVKAFISPATTTAGQNFSNNFSQAGSVTFGVVSGGIGFGSKIGSLSANASATGPQAKITITTGGNITADASVASAGVEGNVNALKLSKGASLGKIEYSEGGLGAKVLALGSDASVSKSKYGMEGEVSSNGELAISLTAGLVSFGLNIDPVKVVKSVVGFFEFGATFIKERVKQELPSFLGGSKVIRDENR